MNCRYCKGNMDVTEQHINKESLTVQKVHECPKCGAKCIATDKK